MRFERTFPLNPNLQFTWTIQQFVIERDITFILMCIPHSEGVQSRMAERSQNGQSEELSPGLGSTKNSSNLLKFLSM